MIAEQLRQRIRNEGPLSIASFMTEALFDPRAGYYATKDPIGAGSDFITAPEISQMFGELMGLWAAQSWIEFGSPKPFHLIELGPGKGTMMADALRAGRAAPGFLDAVQVHLVEASAALKAVQARTLSQTGADIRWSNRLDMIPAGPSLILANEFLDCLPLRQAVRKDGTWHERVVSLKEDAFVFSLGAPLGVDEALIPDTLRDAPDLSLVELRPGDQQVADMIAARFAEHAGRALFFDYGPASPEIGDTLQALRQHEKVDPLDNPGTADLTARVDFAGFTDHAQQAGLTAYGPMEQGEFLLKLGLEQRAAYLMEQSPPHKAALARQIWRLTDAEQMGSLFKVVCLDAAGQPVPPGFARAED